MAHYFRPQNPRAFSHQSANHLQELTNLIYLARTESREPEKVTHYMTIAADRLQLIADLLRKNVWTIS